MIRRAREIEVGDEVFVPEPTGRWCVVTAVEILDGQMRVEFGDAASMVVDYWAKIEMRA